MQHTLEQDAVVEALRSAPRSAWLRLLDAVDVVVLVDDFGTWRGGVQVEGGDGVIDMPWLDYVDEVDRLLEALHGVHAIIDVECMEADVSRQLVTSEFAGVGDVVRLISTIVRMERYSPGRLLRALQDGSMQVLVTRLATWYRATVR